MINKYYSLPLKLASIADGEPEPLAMCSEQSSIDSYLELLLTTCPGEHKFNNEWGCKIWDLDFEIITSKNKWEIHCTEIISQMVNNYEPRLKEVNVIAKIVEVTKSDGFLNTPAIKKKLNIYINATLRSTGEKCCFYYKLYLGPITSE